MDKYKVTVGAKAYSSMTNLQVLQFVEEKKKNWVLDSTELKRFRWL